MGQEEEGRLLLCYVSGLDLRRVDADATPFLAGALERYPWVPLVNIPTNEMLPTLLTGVPPTVHGIWGVRLAPARPISAVESVIDHLPDSLVTGVQGAHHLFTNEFDLAAIPPRRRRRFDITRTKYKRRRSKREALFQIGGIPSLLDVVGADRSRYVFDSSSDPLRRVLPRLCDPTKVLEVFELYSLDRYQQWNLDRPDVVHAFYGRIDRFLRQLHAKCRATGSTLALVSDHGHEPIVQSVDLRSKLATLGLGEDDFSYFLEVSSVRFWFHTPDAKRAILDLCSRLEHGTLLSHTDMRNYSIPLKDESYGEAFFFLDPGHIFFPHDFHHPLANLWLGISDPMQRSRLRDPRHRGNHGHLPHFAAEKAFFLLLNDRLAPATERGHVLDVAPSVLGAMGLDPPSTMTGRALFLPRA